MVSTFVHRYLQARRKWHLEENIAVRSRSANPRAEREKAQAEIAIENRRKSKYAKEVKQLMPSISLMSRLLLKFVLKSPVGQSEIVTPLLTWYEIIHCKRSLILRHSSSKPPSVLSHLKYFDVIPNSKNWILPLERLQRKRRRFSPALVCLRHVVLTLTSSICGTSVEWSEYLTYLQKSSFTSLLKYLAFCSWISEKREDLDVARLEFVLL